MIEIRDFNFEDYLINLKIDNTKNNLLIFENDFLSSEFSKYLAGINKANIFFYDEKVFDSRKYFESRIYIDNSIKYLSSLNKDKVSSFFLINYKKALDKDLFKSLVDKTKLRLNNKYKGHYDFTGKDISISNNILALSILNFRIMHNAFLNMEENIFKEEYNNLKNTIFISSFEKEKVALYDGIIDEVYIFYKKEIIKINDFSILKIKKSENINHVSVIKNLIYEDSQNVYISKDALLDKNLKVKYEIINFFSLEEANE